MADEKAPAAPESVGGVSPILFIVGAVVMLLMGLAGGYAGSQYMASGEVDTTEAGAAGGGDEAAMLAAPATQITSLGNFTVNLRDSAGGRLLQTEIVVESSDVAAQQIRDREPQLRDAVLMLASDYTFTELEGMDGKLRLKDEVHRRVNAVLAPERVNRVYFTSFVVQ